VAAADAPARPLRRTQGLGIWLCCTSCGSSEVHTITRVETVAVPASPAASGGIATGVPDKAFDTV
jgi:hypothetical protein